MTLCEIQRGSVRLSSRDLGLPRPRALPLRHVSTIFDWCGEIDDSTQVAEQRKALERTVSRLWSWHAPVPTRRKSRSYRSTGISVSTASAGETSVQQRWRWASPCITVSVKAAPLTDLQPGCHRPHRRRRWTSRVTPLNPCAGPAERRFVGVETDLDLFPPSRAGRQA